ncbi:MAG: TIGR04282 family arsenosugar biosynthesis glycosyltransferase [Planctomycetota bacterium]|nr:TIGR04282 family arsenosugar biosynthesis glycosyltransferase [Planctomycetota bacterium]
MTSKTMLGVFAKFWEAGKVKTRLACDTNNQFAAEIYQAFLLSTLKRVSGLAEAQILCVTPVERLADFALVTPPNWTITSQSDGDLGERMNSFFQNAIECQIKKTVLIGTDSPTLPVDMIQKAFEALEDVDCVIGPAIDGGYYLIGCQQQVPPIFADIHWSSDKVLEQTIKALLGAGYSYELLPPWFDIDTIDDLRELRKSRDGSSQWLYERLDELEAEHLA